MMNESTPKRTGDGMRILLVNPPDNLAEMIGEGKSVLPRFEPLGILYIAAVLREGGVDVSVLDAEAEGLAVPEMIERILASGADVVGFTSFTANGAVLHEAGRALKTAAPGLFVVFGNLHATVYARQYIQAGCCDAVIHGEGEWLFLELVRRLRRGECSFADMQHVSYRDTQGEIIPGSGWGVVEDLSGLPMPARDLVNRRHYFVPHVNHSLYGGITPKHMFTSRGCPNRCTFCTVHSGQRQRFRPAEFVVDEMEHLIQAYGCDYIFIMDSLFISNRRHLDEIFGEMARRNVSIKWGCEGHVRYITPELVRVLESAGCHDMSFGIESGVQRLLDAVNKKTKIDQIRTAVETVKSNSRIKVSGLFILGLPGETHAESLQTIRFATSLPLDMAQFSILTPYPGSPLFEELRAKGELDDGIRPDGSLDTSVWNRYSAYISYTDKDPIWVTPEQTPAQLKALQKRAVRSFYLRPRHIWDQMRRIRLVDVPKVIRTAFKTFF